MIVGVASLEAPGKMGLRAVLYYMSTTLIAVVLGIVLVMSIQPGDGDKDDITRGEEDDDDIHPLDAIMDLVRNAFPDNMIKVAFEVAKTRQVEITEIEFDEDTQTNITTTRKIPDEGTDEGLNILGLVVASIAFGLVLTKMGDKGKPLIDFFKCLNDATMMLVGIVILYSPIGVGFLICAKLVEMDDIGETLSQIGMYFLTVMCGLTIHMIIVIPTLYFIIVRKNPYKYMFGCMKALLTAFGTASSSATLPITFDCLESKLGIDRRISRFVLPIGATINMDGTALYEAVAAIFIAQMNDMDTGIEKVIVISLTATAVSIGAAGVPQAGLISMIVVLGAAGLPTEDVSLIIAIDWLLDRFRTMVNVWGDSVGAGIVAHLSKAELEEMDRKAEEKALAEKRASTSSFGAPVEYSHSQPHLNGKDNIAYITDEKEAGDTSMYM